MLPISVTACRRRCLALALLLALPALTQAADVAQPADDEDAPNCPVGVFKCAKKPISWAMCKKNDLLDFYVPGLPTEGDRNSVPKDASALNVQSADKTHYVLKGEAQIKQLDLFLRADKITYDTETTDYTANGNVRYQDRGMLMSADQAQGNADLDRCTMNGLRYQLLSSRGNGVAQVAVMDDVDHANLTDATYSTCDIDDQQWAFAAHELELDEAAGVGTGHSVTFRVHNVPVFWLPFMRFPLDDRRESGFLTPMIGYSSRRGLDVTAPYYFNLAPNYDATLLPRLMTDRGVMLGGEFRYITDNNAGQVNVEYIGSDREVHDEEALYDESLPTTRWWYKWKDVSTISPNWGVGVDLNRVSDDRYFEDFGRGLYTTAISFLPSSAYLYGHGTWWNASFGGDELQITDPTLGDQYTPYRRLPRATFNAEDNVLGDLVGGVTSEYIDFGKSSYSIGATSPRIQPLEGQRVDVFPYLSYPIETSSYFIRPQLGYRYTAYDLSHVGDDPAQPFVTKSSLTRGVPIFDLDTGLVFERGLTIGDEAWTQTLEPRAYYLRVPYRNQDDLPVFDTAVVPFSFGQLFRTNGFVGGDRQMDANNLSLALTTRFLEDATGTERVSASLGQIHYFSPQRVQLPTGTVIPAPTDFSGSAYDGELDLHLTDRWRFILDQQWNPNTHQTDLSTVTVQNRFGDDGIVNFSYRFRRDFLEQVDVSASVPITPSWRIIARENYALNDPLAVPTDPHGKAGRNLERFIGFEHDTCCVALRVLARRWIRNIEGDSDDAIYFELEFKGIGSLGQKTDSFLRNAILGYQ